MTGGDCRELGAGEEWRARMWESGWDSGGVLAGLGRERTRARLRGAEVAYDSSKEWAGSMWARLGSGSGNVNWRVFSRLSYSTIWRQHAAPTNYITTCAASSFAGFGSGERQIVPFSLIDMPSRAVHCSTCTSRSKSSAVRARSTTCCTVVLLKYGTMARHSFPKVWFSASLPRLTISFFSVETSPVSSHNTNMYRNLLLSRCEALPNGG